MARIWIDKIITINTSSNKFDIGSAGFVTTDSVASPVLTLGADRTIANDDSDGIIFNTPTGTKHAFQINSVEKYKVDSDGGSNT